MSRGYIHDKTSSSMKSLGKAKFYVEPSWEVRKKVYINFTGHMTKMTAMLIYGKNFQTFFSYRTKSYGHETLHGAVCSQALQSLYK